MVVLFSSLQHIPKCFMTGLSCRSCYSVAGAQPGWQPVSAHLSPGRLKLCKQRCCSSFVITTCRHANMKQMPALQCRRATRWWYRSTGPQPGQPGLALGGRPEPAQCCIPFHSITCPIQSRTASHSAPRSIPPAAHRARWSTTGVLVMLVLRHKHNAFSQSLKLVSLLAT